jgi:hypothetical protein
LIRKPIKDVKVLLTQNIQRAINKADCCGKISLELALCIHMCANVIRPSARDEEEIDEDEDKKYVLGDTLEELD